MTTTPAARIKTRLIIISDTHGQPLTTSLPQADIALHCGDLTEHSRLSELRTTIQLLKNIDAPLKLVIAGNHDFSLDTPVLKKKLAEAERIAGEPLAHDLVKAEFGDFGEARKVLQDAESDGIVFLEEGNYVFSLENGARVKVYASPYTPSNNGNWAYQYTDSHGFNIDPDTDIVMTHGPPQGILDRTQDRKRIGCPELFAAVARTQPLVHCFGHVHSGWGAKVVKWRERISERPSHFVDVDNGESVVLDSLALLRGRGGG